MRRIQCFAMLVIAVLGGCQTPPQPVGAQAPALGSAPAGDGAVSALGRIEPDDGVIRVAGPSQPAVVVAELLIDDGDTVRQGQALAVLDTRAVAEASVAQIDAELRRAEAEWGRAQTLRGQGVVSSSEYETWEAQVATIQPIASAAAP
jgi:HlyD family secretion protein